MSNLDDLTLKEWQDIALATDKEDSNFIMVGGFVAGVAMASVTAFPPTGIITALWIWCYALKKTEEINKNDKVIAQGLIPHTLKGDHLEQYKKQFGEQQTALQIDQAIKRGFLPTNDAEDFVDDFINSGNTQSPIPNTQYQTSNVSVSDRPRHDKYKAFRDVGVEIIKQAGKPGKSKALVAPSRTGKTTVLYFMLDQAFSLHSDLTVFAWQGKGIEPIHPNVPKQNHYGFNLQDIDLGAINAIWEIYEQRQQLLEQGVREFSPVVLAITDWQSIKDLLSSAAKDIFKIVQGKLMTLANNGAALGTTIWIDTQSPKISDWGLGSSSIRDNFDIFAIARIGYDEDNTVIGDCNCVTKTAQNPMIVSQESDRTRVLTQFAQLQEGMKAGDIKSSVILSTAGIVRIGITPQFERSALQFETATKTNCGDINDKVLSLIPNNWIDINSPEFIIGIHSYGFSAEQIRDCLFELQSLNLIEIDSNLSKIRKI
ncbi:hypothetical protein NIES25_52260 [Nostoc linckia NIES-25]|nr:hypothetical protein NIES25_52260 [Nostoc linckia NIES-25]